MSKLEITNLLIQALIAVGTIGAVILSLIFSYAVNKKLKIETNASFSLMTGSQEKVHFPLSNKALLKDIIEDIIMKEQRESVQLQLIHALDTDLDP